MNSREEVDAFWAAFGIDNTVRKDRCNIGYIKKGRLIYCCVTKNGSKAPAMLRKHYNDARKIHALVCSNISRLGTSPDTTRYIKNELILDWKAECSAPPSYVTDALNIYGIERFMLREGGKWHEYYL